MSSCFCTLCKDFTMNSKTVVVVAVQLMLACAPLTREAAALDRDNDPDQLWNIGWELSQDCLRHRETLRVKDNRQGRMRERSRMPTKSRQSDLLGELLPPRDRSPVVIRMKKEKKTVHKIRYRVDTQETGLLEELLAEASKP
jgi:hypothetical protein